MAEERSVMEGREQRMRRFSSGGRLAKVISGVEIGGCRY